jgi:hypothetical protein
MGAPTREWAWPKDGYKSVRLFILNILPPTRDQITEQVESVIGKATNVAEIEEGVRAIRNPYLPFRITVASDRARPEPDRESVDIEVRTGR